MEPPREAEERQPGWYAVALNAALQTRPGAQRRGKHEFEVDGTTFHLRIQDGQYQALYGHAATPAFILRCTLDDFLASTTRNKSPTNNQLRGSCSADKRFRRAFPLPAPETLKAP